VIFKNLPVLRYDTEGCLISIASFLTFGIVGKIYEKKWQVNIAVTNKRVVCVPIPPNPKNFPVESFYYSKIKVVETSKAKIEVERNKANFWLEDDGGYRNFSFIAKGGFLKAFKAQRENLLANSFGGWVDSAISGCDKKYSEIFAEIKEKVHTPPTILDHSRNVTRDMDYMAFFMEHIQQRDFLFLLINMCWKQYK